MATLESLRLMEGFLLTFQFFQPLPRIRQFGEAGASVLPEGEEYTNQRLDIIMSGPNLAEAKQVLFQNSI